MRQSCSTTQQNDAVAKEGCGIRILGVASMAVSAVSLLLAPAVVAAPISTERFNSLAASCAPGVSATVLRAVAAKESGFDPLALHNNTHKITRMAADAKAASALAQSWIAAGDSVDVGLMQINAPNLPRLGLSVAQAFDPCLSLAAGAAVLRDAYHQGATQAEQQAALLIMLSRYNTGRPLAGLVNGYVADVIAAPSKASQPLPPQADAAGPTPPEWNVWANARYAQAHGAAWLVDLTNPSPAPLTQTTPPQGAPAHQQR